MKFGDSGRSVLSVFSLSVRHTECVTQLFPARRPSTHSLSHCCNQYTNGRNLLLKPENKDLSINRFACSERTAESLRRKMLRTFWTLSECGVWKCGHSYVKHDVKLDFGIFRIFQSIWIFSLNILENSESKYWQFHTVCAWRTRLWTLQNSSFGSGSSNLGDLPKATGDCDLFFAILWSKT